MQITEETEGYGKCVETKQSGRAVKLWKKLSKSMLTVTIAATTISWTVWILIADTIVSGNAIRILIIWYR